MTKATDLATAAIAATQQEKPYLVALRNPNGLLMHAGIRRADNPDDAMVEYLNALPAPFSQYEILISSTTHNDDHVQASVAFGPFLCTVTSEHLTAAQDQPPRAEG